MDRDDQIWDDWLAWLRSAPPFAAPGPAFAHYAERLVAAGRSEVSVERELDAIVRLMRVRTDGWQILFNNIYACPTPTFATAPNALLASVVQGLAVGRALDLCTGQGRNAVYLARAGWTVTAVDVADTGLAVAAEEARRAGVSLETVCESMDVFELGEDRWDLVVLTYTPAPVTERSFVQRLTRALRPGGTVVIESFASDTSETGRRPVDIDPAALRSAFGAFAILWDEDVVTASEWEQIPVRIVRFAARMR